jgi:hypothetical protein
LRRDRFEIARLDKEIPRAAKDRHTGLRRPDSPARTGQKIDPDLSLQGLNALCDSRGSEVEPARRFRDGAILHDGNECFEKASIHT